MVRRRLPSIFSVCFLVAASAARGADDALFRTLTIDDEAGLEIGRGFDVLSGNPRADCVDRTGSGDHASFGPDVFFQSHEITDNEQLDQALGMSASANFHGGAGSASASATFSKSLNVESYSLSYIINASLTAKGPSLRDVKLKPQYLRLLKSGKLDRFRGLCGDGYIGEFIVGGEFKALIQIHTASRAERQALSGSVSASMSMASGSASFSSLLATISKTNETKILTYRRGGSGTPIAITPDTIAAQASALPEIVRLSPVPVRMSIFSYITLLDDPTIPLFDFDKREDEIVQLSHLYDAARDREVEINYIISHGSEFYIQDPDFPKLMTERNQIINYKSSMQNLAKTCVQKPDACAAKLPQLPNETVRPGRR